MRAGLGMYKVIGIDGQVYGPVDTATLQRWCQEGRIVADTQLINPSGQVMAARFAMELGPYLLAPHAPPNFATYPRGYGMPASSKSKVAAILLAFFLGPLGIHRFYLGHTASGVAMLLISVVLGFTCGIGFIVTGIWALVDTIMIATGSLTDVSGQPLS